MKGQLLEQLYASPELEEAFRKGREYERANHKCRVKVVEKKVFATRKEHPRSKWRKYGVVSKGQLLNPTFNTKAEAVMFLVRLVPARQYATPEMLPTLEKMDAQVVKLF